MEIYQKPSEQVFLEFETRPSGLDPEEVEHRREKAGDDRSSPP